MSEAFERLRSEAMALGCSWFGTAPAAEHPEDLAALREWLAAQRHGDMAWLAREPERRADPGRVLEGCRTVAMVGINYLREPLPSSAAAIRPPGGAVGRISKYARTRDYHRVLENILRKLARCIDTDLAPGSRSRGYVDYGPVMERPWAVRAGLGFVGKHTLLIDPKTGSFHFLGVILTTADIPGPAPAIAESCGNCRRCIDACPTGAIVEPYRLDARRCLSYLTIEKSGPVDPAFAPNYRGNLFGCDICQDVCPYNQSRAVAVEASPLGALLVPPEIPLVDLLGDPEGFLARIGETATPLKRAGAESLLRNALIVAGEQGDSECREAARVVAADARRPDWLRELAARVAERLGQKRPA